MTMNTAKKMMLEGKPALGAAAGLNSPLAAETLALAGYDFVMIDDQHGLWDPSNIVAAVRSIRVACSIPMARTQKNDFGQIGAMLDRGVLGIVVPMVNSVADARAAAYAMRFPPRGGRSYGPYGCAIYGADYPDWANDEVFLAVQIESKEAAQDVEAIMAVDGIDGCWIGPNDLSRSMRVAMWSEPHLAAIDRTLQACKKLGKIPGIAFGDMPHLIEQGFLFVTPGDDRSPIDTVGRATLRQLRG